ncbi:MAG: hypothetical protein WC989_04345 [Micavibrio sp.]
MNDDITPGKLQRLWGKVQSDLSLETRGEIETEILLRCGSRPLETFRKVRKQEEDYITRIQNRMRGPV